MKRDVDHIGKPFTCCHLSDAYVPSLEDTLYFIDTIPDIRDKAMLSLLYSAGLRIGELCHLRSIRFFIRTSGRCIAYFISKSDHTISI